MSAAHPEGAGAHARASRWWPVSIRWSAALVLVALLNALCFPLIAVGLRDAPRLAFASLRALVAGLALAVPAMLQRRPLPREPRIWLVLAAIGLGTTSLGFLGMFDADELVAPGLATVLLNTQPLVAAVLAGGFLHERLLPLQRLGLLVGFLGITALGLPSLSGTRRATFVLGIAYIALATTGVAVGNVLMKAVRARVDPLVAMGAQMLLGAIPLAIAASLLEHTSAIAWSAGFIATLLALAVLGTALSNWLWFTTLAHVPLSRANAFSFLTPLIAYLIGTLYFAERIGPSAIIGLGLATGGVVLVQRTPPESSSRAER